MSIHLSEQERRLLRGAARGKTDKEVAEEMSITVGTVSTYWQRIRGKLEATNRTHAVAIFIIAHYRARIERIEEGHRVSAAGDLE